MTLWNNLRYAGNLRCGEALRLARLDPPQTLRDE